MERSNFENGNGQEQNPESQAPSSTPFDILREVEPATESPEQKERQEKLKHGIKIVVGGPPHSGKSVFIEALTANLDKDNTFSFSAAPDGEGPWLQRHYDDPDVVKWRQKGQFSEAFVEDRKQKIASWDGPLMIIDIGGRTSPENAEMIKGATHAIILAGSDDGRAIRGTRNPNKLMPKDKDPHSAMLEMKRWQDFFDENGLETIARLHSDYSGTTDHQISTESSSLATSSVHHLERGKPAFERETIKQVAGIINDLVENNEAYKTAHEGDTSNPFEVFIPDVFSDLPSETKHVRFKNRQGEWVERDNKTILRSAIPMIYEKASQADGQPVWLNGPVNSWEATALACAYDDAESEDIRLRGPDGYIKTKKLPQDADLDSKWYDEPPQKQGELDGHPIYFVHNTAHASNNPVSPSDLETMAIPILPTDAIAIISSQGPNWLKASMALGYKDKIHAVAAFQPGEGSTIAWSQNKDELGRIVEKGESPERKNEENTKEAYLQKAHENLLATSRTANGNVDTSASATKAESMETTDGEKAKQLVNDNFNHAFSFAFDRRNDRFSSPEEVETFITAVAQQLNAGIVKDGALIRNGEDSVKYPYTRIADLPSKMHDFFEEFYTRISSPNSDPIETAAFAEYNIDLSGHFYSDGCGKIAKIISAFALMRNNMPLPTYKGGRAEYYAHAPKHIAGEDPNIDQTEYQNFLDYYRTLFNADGQ